ncbi:MAG: hypothetical protein KDB27_15160, partial [Planctomycetales bacterium]|nr:hypothetical protein [Planctomycetales bacterium]
TIRGIWTDQAGHYRKFRVADETESRQLEIDYGPDVGLIQLVVFREAAEAVKPQLTQVEKAALKTAGVKTGMFSEDKAAFMVAYGDLSSIPEDLDSISEDLSSTPDEREGTVRKIIVESVWRDLNGSQSRGVITPGQIAKSKELREEEERNWDPNPIGSAVWRYRHSR